MSSWIEMPISKGMTTKIDVADYERLKKEGITKWSAQKTGKRFYVSRNATRNGVHLKIYLHRWIMDAPTQMVVDHINRDSLDNRRSNLRICFQRDNARNKAYNDAFGSPKIHGVVPSRKPGKWVAQLNWDRRFGGNLGSFSAQEDAARVYDLVAVLLHGEFAQPNYAASWKFLKLRKCILDQSQSNPVKSRS